MKMTTLLAIIAKYGVLINELDDSYYTLLEVSTDKKALIRVRTDDWTAERAIIASNSRVYYIDTHTMVIICGH